MIMLTKRNHIFAQRIGDLRTCQNEKKVLAFYRKGLLFAFNFHPTNSYQNVKVPVPANADYEVRLSSDDKKYGGQELIAHMTYPAKQEKDGSYYIELYLPSRTAVVLKEGRIRKAKKKTTKKVTDKK